MSVSVVFSITHSPFEVIGCIFDHSLSEKCIYGSKCTIKLCSFQHEKHVGDANKHVENDEESKNSSKAIGDNDVKKQ